MVFIWVPGIINAVSENFGMSTCKIIKNVEKHLNMYRDFVDIAWAGVLVIRQRTEPQCVRKGTNHMAYWGACI